MCARKRKIKQKNRKKETGKNEKKKKLKIGGKSESFVFVKILKTSKDNAIESYWLENNFSFY